MNALPSSRKIWWEKFRRRTDKGQRLVLDAGCRDIMRRLLRVRFDVRRQGADDAEDPRVLEVLDDMGDYLGIGPIPR